MQYDRRCAAQHDPKDDERKQRTCSATRIGRMLQRLSDGGKWSIPRGRRQDCDYWMIEGKGVQLFWGTNTAKTHSAGYDTRAA